MGLLSQCVLPKAPNDFEAWQELLPRLAGFFTSGPGVGLEQLALLGKWGQNDWLDLTTRTGAFNALQGLTQLWADWYVTHDAITLSLAFACWSSIACWLMQEITGNLSQVDRLWTFLPVIYSAHFTFYWHIQQHGLSNLVNHLKTFTCPEAVDPRMLLVFALQCLWSARLTRNAFYRGFFNFKEEDYRWPIVRRNLPKWAMHILSLTFIAFIQNFLLLSTSLPQVFLLLTRSRAPVLGMPDYLLAGLTVSLLVIEQIADSQQQRYQTWKRSPEAAQASFGDSPEAKAAAAKLARGFNTEGLWGWCRHPNFTCEQLHWYSLYLFTLRITLQDEVVQQSLEFINQTAVSVQADRTVDWSAVKQFLIEAQPYFANYALAGPVAMTLLFYSSTILTERISAGKYSRYAAYQRRVVMFWPPDSCLKVLWLLVKGQLGRTNEVVFRSGRAPKPTKKQ